MNINERAYNDYCLHFNGYEDIPSMDWYVNEIKTNPSFSERWGLKIEERELSLEERLNLYFKLNPEFRLVHENMNKQMDKFNIPTKLITITYNNETIEIYE